MTEKKSHPPVKRRSTTGLFAQPLTQPINALYQNLPKARQELMRLALHWPDVAGDEMAPHTRPAKLHYTKTSGVLTIACHSAFSLEIQHTTPQLLERVARVLGHGKIQRIALAPLSF